MIKHIKCDIFDSGADIILHQVNCQGVMGSGVAKQVKDKFPEVYKEYKSLCNELSADSLLGEAQFVSTRSKYGTNFIGIFNLFAQKNFGYNGKCYTDYNALRNCLNHVRNSLPRHGMIIGIPYLMACYRGGGDWNTVYNIIKEIFGDDYCDVLICEYNGG